MRRLEPDGVAGEEDLFKQRDGMNTMSKQRKSTVQSLNPKESPCDQGSETTGSHGMS